MSSGNKQVFYAVRKGRNPGIYYNWDDCKKEVLGYDGSIYKKFKTKKEAYVFISTTDKIFKREEKKKLTSTIKKTDIDLENFNVVDKIEDINLIGYIPRNNYYHIFTDGSRQKSHSAYGVYFPGCKTQFAKEITNDKMKTNNIAELLAIKSALEIIIFSINNGKLNIPVSKEIYIVSDSQYSIKSVSIWYKKWEKNGWVNSKKEPVANADIIRNILDLLNEIRTNFRINIEFKHQLAHKSSPTTNKNLLEYYLWEGNYCVDYLVQKAVISE